MDEGPAGEVVGEVGGCLRYPVKSMQGLEVTDLELTDRGVVGDRTRGLVTDGATLLSAKQRAELLQATADDDGIELPDGRRVDYGSPDADAALSDWMGRPVRLGRPEEGASVSYRMTFDPPNDAADLVDIPTPAGSFLDAAPVHLVTTATLDGCRAARPDLDWDVRRFRPNLVLAAPGPPFLEDGWVGRRLAVGAEVVLEVDQPTVRCAMPLRAQPGLAREAGLFEAMNELNGAHPNHLGVYASVTVPGTVTRGDQVRLLR